MNLNVHWISKSYVELKVDEINTGTMDKEEAKELAIDLINVAAELLGVEERK